MNLLELKLGREIVGLPVMASLLVALLAGGLTAGEKQKAPAGKSAEQQPQELDVYIGTYTGGGSEGIYRARLDLKTGKLSEPTVVAKIDNPSFLAFHPTEPLLYAVNELSKFNGEATGAVTALSVPPGDGPLTVLNQESSHGTGPCHLIVSPDGGHVLLANYGGGSIAVLPIEKDGKLGKATAAIQHKGQGAAPRNRPPHAHSIHLSPDSRFAMAADLGLDQILIYHFDSKQGTLTPAASSPVKLAPIAGPRHFAWHPNGRNAYVINETTLTVSAMNYDAKTGELTVFDTLSTIPEVADRKGFSTAEVQVHPSGRFLYGSNRGHDTIATFQIDPKTGKLTATGHTSTRGKTPRNFGIDPTGQFLLAANQSSNTIAVFRINQETGALEPVGEPVASPKPVCIKFRRVSP